MSTPSSAKLKPASPVLPQTLGPHDLALMVEAIDPVPKFDFERLLQLAARVVGMPMGAITLVEGGKHFAPYSVGIKSPDRTVYICAHAIKGDDLLIITDTLEDPRVSQMKVVTGPPHVRFYAGVPLISPVGKRLGTLAVMDRRPRVLTEQQKEDIKTFAYQVMIHLELRHQREELHALARNLEESHRLAHLGNWEWEQDSDNLTWSRELYRIFGRRLADPIEKSSNFLQQVHQEDRDRVRAVRDDCLKTLLPYELNYRIIRPDGEIRCIHERGEGAKDSRGNLAGLFGYAQDMTETWRAEQARRESDALFRSMFEQAAVGITLTQLDGKFVKVNQRFASLLGYTPEELAQVSFQSLTHPDDLASDMRQLNRLLQGECETYSLEKRFICKNGTTVWANVTVSAGRNADGARLHLIAVVEDIGARKQAEADLRGQQQLTSEIIDALPVNIYVKDAEGRYLMFNQEAAKTAAVLKSEAIGKTDFDFFSKQIATTIREKDRQVLLGEEQTLEEATIPIHGEERVMLAGRKAIHTAGSSPRLLGFSIDINDRKQSELRAQYLATHDPLTGLPNRSLLHDRLDHAIAHAHRSGCLVTVMFLDLDRFKLINDSLGHKSGDQLLQIMAGRLQQVVREGDTVARLGGDEFVILVEGLASEDEATHIAGKILAQVAVPVSLDSQHLVISTSIGISLYPKDSKNANVLLKQADTAMYQAKDKGGNGLRYFDPEMNLQVLERFVIENGLRRALELEELVLRYQPIVDLKTGRIVGMEALVRWEHPEKGLLGPGEFIAVAEETGLIIELGEWVLRRACRQQQEWCDKGLSGLRMAVNLSAKQFCPRNLVKMVRSVLEETRMDGALLKLEITETGLMQDVARAQDALRELAAMGIELAIDDFGTGYSSLSYLKTLPIDTLKVDRSFVNDVATDADDAAIVSATIGLAHSLGLRVIAEGVETSKQLSFLACQQCDEGQGYYFSSPLGPRDMENLLMAGKPFVVPAESAAIH